MNLTVNLGKPMIPLLMEKMAWPPSGSMGPIFSEYLFIRFFQRPGEETNDDRIWPTAKFMELLMQLNCLKVMPDEKIITKGMQTEYFELHRLMQSCTLNFDDSTIIKKILEK